MGARKVTNVLLDLAAMPPARLVGAKAARLGWLIDRGWPVPAGVVAPFPLTRALADPDPSTLEPLRTELAQRLDPVRPYVIRSSANAEDHGSRSFAGQFLSVMDVSGVDAALAAMRDVARSVSAPHVRAYAERLHVATERLHMAVIIQEMVRPVASGVAFSRDPVSGAERVVIEAVAGRGDSLVGRGSTPQRWVWAASGMLEEPPEPLLPVDVVAQVVDAARGVATDSGEAVDVEWVWDSERLWLVQWRPITALTEGARTWSCRMAKDMLPGLVPPLVWSVNVPVLTGVWVDLLDDALGPTGLDPDTLARPFGYRAYFDMGAFGAVFRSLGMPVDALEQMRAGTSHATLRPSPTAVLRRAPRLLRFAVELNTWSRDARVALREIERTRRREAADDVTAMPDDALLARVDRLRTLLGQVARLNVVTPLLADAYAAAARRAAARVGLPPGDVDPGRGNLAARRLDPGRALAALDPADDAAWHEFLDRFGHLSDSPNDCSRPTWSEQPEAIHRLAGGGERSDLRDDDGRLSLLDRTPRRRRASTARRWSRAATLRVAREHVGYTYARVYALFRPTFLEIGRRLADRGHLTRPDDVFLLTLDELRAALAAGHPDASSAPPTAHLTARRREEMAAAAGLDWPETIVGDDPIPVLGRAHAHVLVGLPTSRGRHTGPARVVTSLASAPPIDRDDVLVLEAADITWTPLLLRAGAVVTETGGMLAHASIVARELGLPCVASVPGATRIPDGTRLCVDGGSGEVLVLDGARTGSAG